MHASLHAEKPHVEVESGVGGDGPPGGTSMAVGERWGDDEIALASHLHALETWARQVMGSAGSRKHAML